MQSISESKHRATIQTNKVNTNSGRAISEWENDSKETNTDNSHNFRQIFGDFSIETDFMAEFK